MNNNNENTKSPGLQAAIWSISIFIVLLILFTLIESTITDKPHYFPSNNAILTAIGIGLIIAYFTYRVTVDSNYKKIQRYRRKNTYVYVCRKCGFNHLHYEKIHCPYCDTVTMRTNMHQSKYLNLSKYDLHVWEEELLEKVKASSEFDASAHQYYVDKVKEYESGQQSFASGGSITCPTCGSRNIQMVNRKWSVATGFFTQKVDRVCMNCKKRF